MAASLLCFVFYIKVAWATPGIDRRDRAVVAAAVTINRMSETPASAVRTIVATNEAPRAIGPYSQGVRAGSLLFTSGQIPLDPETQQVVAGGIAEQTAQVFANLKAILEAGGSSLSLVLKATVFLKNFDDFAAMNAIYAEHLTPGGAPAPARTTVEVSRLPKDVLIEIDLVAIVAPE
jgi:2-iminobutanoate/2-iminopropanoate deaminase